MSQPTTPEEFMTEACALAAESVASGGGPFGTVIVKDGVIVGRGMNRVTVHHDPTAHGEIVAIRDACTNLDTFQLTGCTLYTNAEPCPMCFGAIYWARPDAVYFANTKAETAAIGFDDVFITTEFEKSITERAIPFTHLSLPEAGEAFRLWSTRSEKTEY